MGVGTIAIKYGDDIFVREVESIRGSDESKQSLLTCRIHADDAPEMHSSMRKDTYEAEIGPSLLMQGFRENGGYLSATSEEAPVDSVIKRRVPVQTKISLEV